MKIACFDMEGTLTPEIWEQVALDTGIEGFNKTTREIPDYAELMDFRLELMASNNLGISDIQNAVNSMIDAIDPAEDNRGPVEFKKHAAAVVLSRAIERAWQRA